MLIDATLVDRLYLRAKCDRWGVGRARFADALQSSVQRAFAGPQHPRESDLERYLSALHLEDLALACACAEGNEQAWEHFVLSQRPLLYRAAAAIDPGGGARDLADSLYGELFGVREVGGERQSLFRYFHGRSSLTTWLRAVLAQRHVDRLRTERRVEELPDEDSPHALPAPAPTHDPNRDRYLELMRRAVAQAIASLDARDRLRLACYYAQQLTLAETGRMLGEHEATSSRQLARTRRIIKDEVERLLRVDARLTDQEIAECFESVSDDPGTLNVENLLDGSSGRKESALDRSR